MNVKEQPLDHILQESRDIHTWAISSLDGIPFPVNKRLLISIAAFDVVLDHFTGITALIEKRVYGAAFALARPLFETFVRAVWLKDCATDQDLIAFERDEFSRSCGQVLKEIEKLESFKSGSLSNLKKQAWSAMSSYTHGGFQQIARRVKGKTIDPNYMDEEIIEVLRLSQAFALMAFIQIVLVAGRGDMEQLAIQKLYETGLFLRQST